MGSTHEPRYLGRGKGRLSFIRSPLSAFRRKESGLSFPFAPAAGSAEMVNEVLSHERPFSFPIRETLRPFDSARSTQNLSGTIQAATVETTEISTQTDNMDSLNRIYSLINPVIQAHGIDHVLWRMRRDRKSTRLNSSHSGESRMPSSA